jgi:hypothetical protein
LAEGEKQNTETERAQKLSLELEDVGLIAFHRSGFSLLLPRKLTTMRELAMDTEPERPA